MYKFVFKILLLATAWFIIISSASVAAVTFKLNRPDTSRFKKNQLNSDSWFSRDKGVHFGGSLIATVLISKAAEQSAGFSCSQANNSAAGITFALGIGKELVDSQKAHGFFSWKDLAADVAGVAVGLIILRIR